MKGQRIMKALPKQNKAAGLTLLMSGFYSSCVVIDAARCPRKAGQMGREDRTENLKRTALK